MKIGTFFLRNKRIWGSYQFSYLWRNAEVFGELRLSDEPQKGAMELGEAQGAPTFLSCRERQQGVHIAEDSAMES